MTPQVTDPQQLKEAISELLQSDKDFMRKLVRETLVDMATNKLELEDKQSRRKALREKYKQRGGIQLSVINALQQLFNDTPFPSDMTQMLSK